MISVNCLNFPTSTSWPLSPPVDSEMKFMTIITSLIVIRSRKTKTFTFILGWRRCGNTREKNEIKAINSNELWIVWRTCGGGRSLLMSENCSTNLQVDNNVDRLQDSEGIDNFTSFLRWRCTDAGLTLKHFKVQSAPAVVASSQLCSDENLKVQLSTLL